MRGKSGFTTGGHDNLSSYLLDCNPAALLFPIQNKEHGAQGVNIRSLVDDAIGELECWRSIGEVRSDGGRHVLQPRPSAADWTDKLR